MGSQTHRLQSQTIESLLLCEACCIQLLPHIQSKGIAHADTANHAGAVAALHMLKVLWPQDNALQLSKNKGINHMSPRFTMQMSGLYFLPRAASNLPQRGSVSVQQHVRLCRAHTMGTPTRGWAISPLASFGRQLITFILIILGLISVLHDRS